MRGTWIAAISLTWLVVGCEAPAPRPAPPPVAVSQFDASAPQPGGSSSVGFAIAAGTSVAIGRVEGTEDGGVELVSIAPTEQGYWGHRFSEVTNVRDVRFVSPRSVDKSPLRNFALRSAAEADASLLLLYALNFPAGSPVEAVGVVIDVQSGQTLFSTRASADGPTTAELANKTGDHREQDGQFQSARKFETAVVAMLADAARRVPAASGNAPHNWSVPADQRWWLGRPGRRN